MPTPWVTAALTVFDHHTGPQPDAITGTRYEHRPGAGAVGEQQRIALTIARRLGVLLPHELADADTTLRCQRDAWQDVVGRGLARPAHTPEEHFRERVHAIRADMLRLKVSPDLSRPALPRRHHPSPDPAIHHLGSLG